MKRESRTRLRNAAILHRMKELYELKRLRLDDVYQQLATEFFLTEMYVRRIVKEAPDIPVKFKR